MKYKVLVLPNTACLDEKQAEAVRLYVEKGGGLVASLDASLCDEFGTPRKSPLLEEVLGVERQGIAAAPVAGKELDENFARTLPPDYWAKRKGVWDFRRLDVPRSFLESPRLDELIGKTHVTFKGPVVRVKPKPGAQVLATVQPTGDPKAEAIPAVVLSQFGQGKVVYLAAGFDAAYYSASYPYYRMILAQAIRAVASATPPVEVAAPMCVQMNVVRQKKDGERVIVHLFNDVSTTAGHGHPAEEVPHREEVLPIHDIAVTFRGYGIKRVHLEPDGKELGVKKAGDADVVTVPKLTIHAMVVAELG